MKKSTRKPKIVELVVEVEMGRISWRHGEERVEVAVPQLTAAMADRDAQNVFALCEADAKSHPTRLVGFSAKGELLFKVGPPEGFVFSYLAHHAAAPIAVVAMGEYVPGGFPDWHFSISPTGELEKVSPAY
jgi:hypothetical protein